MGEELTIQLQTLRMFFDTVRIVNPLTNHILWQEENGQFVKQQENQPCYGIWGCKRSCENCISIQALRTKETVEKLEYIDRDIFLIMARVMYDGQTEYVVEAIRNVTDSTLIEQIEHKTRVEIQSEIQALNNRLIKDDMIGCYTRMYLDNRLPAMIAQQKTPMTHPIAVSFFDLDNFKLINDRYGHQVGDQLLRAIGRNLRKQILNEHFWMARVGGDELVFVSENATPAQAVQLFGQVKTIIEKTQVTVANQAYIQVQVSYGYSVVQTSDTAESVLARADEAMYHHKKQKK